MTIAYWCVLAAALLPYVFTLVAKSAGRYNNYAPREFLEKQQGIHKRAHWVQLNSFEAFPAFTAAVIIAHLSGADQGRIDTLAMAFIAIRIVYGITYLANMAMLRSAVWMAGILTVVAIFTAGA